MVMQFMKYMQMKEKQQNKDLNVEVSVVMPCLNEARTLANCIKIAEDSMIKNNIKGEIVVADNGSTDGSVDIAKSLGARVVEVSEKGYGNALNFGIKNSLGRYIIMADSDMSYDFADIPRFLEKLKSGYDLVMGNRFSGGIKEGAMSFSHKYIGNPILSGIGRLFFGNKCKDFHCGIRGFDKTAITKLDLKTTGMEFASEMIVKSMLANLRITEIPVNLYPDGRNRPPHLRSWRDGWRHLRFLLVFSPRWLFLYPGIFTMVVGLIISSWLLIGPQHIGSITLNVDTLLYSSTAIIIGFQAVIFAFLTKVFAINEGILPQDKKIEWILKWLNLETGLIVGSMVLIVGLILAIASIVMWQSHSFGVLDTSESLRLVIPASVMLALGFEIVMFSFFFSILGLKHR